MSQLQHSQGDGLKVTMDLTLWPLHTFFGHGGHGLTEHTVKSGLGRRSNMMEREHIYVLRRKTR